jgi:hypothetical protein
MKIPALMFALAGGLIPLHMLFYALLVRRMRGMYGERQIFLYHLASACTVTVLALCAWFIAPSAKAATMAIALIAAHGIYSMTFLEFWSLSQISYSREILLCAQRGEIDDAGSVPARLVEIGDVKRSGRIGSLQQLGLLVQRDGALELTGRGRVASALLRLLQWLPNMRGAG